MSLKERMTDQLNREHQEKVARQLALARHRYDSRLKTVAEALTVLMPSAEIPEFRDKLTGTPELHNLLTSERMPSATVPFIYDGYFFQMRVRAWSFGQPHWDLFALTARDWTKFDNFSQLAQLKDELVESIS